MAYPHEVTHNFPPDDAVGKVCSDSHDPEKHCLQTTGKVNVNLHHLLAAQTEQKRVKTKVILAVYFRFLTYTGCSIMKAEA